MAVNLAAPGPLLAIPGIRVGASAAGVKRAGTDRLDLAVIERDRGGATAGVFTRSAFVAAPVQICRAHLAAAADPCCLLINSGNANAATGTPGRADALALCADTAAHLGIAPQDVLPFSTGVIGQRLPVERMRAALPAAVADRQADHWLRGAAAIMTTDTVAKGVSREAVVGGRPVRCTGIAKGAGMIRPDMATMLAFVGTDAAISAAALAAMVREVADASFNRITIDGDTSTNDSFVVMASGAAGNARIEGPGDPGHAELRALLVEVAADLAQRIVRDGEGATRFVTVRVEGGATPDECLQVAYTIAESPLVKTAVFAGDPNWGRFCMAIGRAGIAGLDQGRVALWLDDVAVGAHGLMAADYTEAAGAAVMARPEFTVRVDLGRGECAETVWTCDLSYEYVRINAEYRT